ncbi:MAG: hypothetical protein Q8O76_06390 [Chloroflexota bacterium]|nr:hypothetical protein [Chloroflexota bacterium]
MTVAVSPQRPWEGVAYFDINSNGDFTDDGMYRWGGGETIVETSLRYPEGERPYAFGFSMTIVYTSSGPIKQLPISTPTPGGPPTPTPTPVPTPTPTPLPQTGILRFHTHHIRIGQLPGADSRPVALVDANSNGRFNDPDDRLVVDLNGDGLADGSRTSLVTEAEHFRLDTPFYLGGKPWKLIGVSASGDEARFGMPETGTLTGVIYNQYNLAPLVGAKVRVFPGPLETKTDASGWYYLTAAEGLVRKVIVTQDGYVPVLEKSKGMVPPRGTLPLSFGMKPLPAQRGGTITLTGTVGYHFLEATPLQFLGTDFMVFGMDIAFGRGTAIIEARPEWGNRGIIYLGNLGPMALQDVVPPPAGYRFSYWGVSVGDVYVAQAREGEEGHYIVFRITKIEKNETTLEYFYR